MMVQTRALESASGMSADAALLAEIDENLIRTTQTAAVTASVSSASARGR